MRCRAAHELLQSYFGCVLLGVVDILPVVPEACVDYLVAFDGDGRGPRGASASTIGDDIENGRVLLREAAVVCR